MRIKKPPAPGVGGLFIIRIQASFGNWRKFDCDNNAKDSVSPQNRDRGLEFGQDPMRTDADQMRRRHDEGDLFARLLSTRNGRGSS